MEILSKLQHINPLYQIYHVNDTEFKTYGQVLHVDMKEAIDYVKTQDYQDGYIPSIKELEDLESIQTLSKDVYGYLDVMAGVVQGKNHVLNGLEYHQCSETIIALTDYVLAVGHRWDMDDLEYDSSLVQCFYVPQGTVIECYATTLHYTPISVNSTGFQTICLLLSGTGDSVSRRGLLKKKNKWFIAHKDNVDKVQAGDYPGLKGTMVTIQTIEESGN